MLRVPSKQCCRPGSARAPVVVGVARGLPEVEVVDVGSHHLLIVKLRQQIRQDVHVRKLGMEAGARERRRAARCSATIPSTSRAV